MWVLWCPIKDAPDAKRVLIADLPISLLGEIGKPYELTWLDLIQRPIVDAGAFEALYRRCCTDVGVEPVAALTARNIYYSNDIIDFDVDAGDLPNEYEESGIPLEGGPETTSSSGQPESSTGHPTSSDGSPTGTFA